MVTMQPNEGEKVADFLTRARRSYAQAGDVFDFPSWLREFGPTALTAMSDESWAPYKLIIDEQKEVAREG